MLSHTSISEVSISETASEEFVPVETLLYRDKRPVMVIGQGFFRADLGNDFDGSPIFVEMERLGIAVEGVDRGGNLVVNPASVKLVREVWPLIRGDIGTEIDIYVGFQPKTPEDTVSWQGPFPFVIGTDTSVKPLVEGAFIALRLESEDQPPWSLLAYRMDIERTGVVYD